MTVSQLFVRYYRLILVVLVILTGAGGYYLLVPKYKEAVVESKNKLDILKTQRQNQLSYLENLKSMMANYENIGDREIEKLSQVLPAEKDIPGLFVQLQALADSHGFVLTSVNISQVPGSKDSVNSKIKKLNVSVNLIGRGYESLKSFLETTEYNLRLFDVNAVYFSPDSDSYAINFFTYYLAD